MKLVKGSSQLNTREHINLFQGSIINLSNSVFLKRISVLSRWTLFILEMSKVLEKQSQEYYDLNRML